MPKLSMPADLQENSLVRYMVFRYGGGMTEPQGARYPSFPADSKKDKIFQFRREFSTSRACFECYRVRTLEREIPAVYTPRKGAGEGDYERRLGTH